jgi:hypothetical protein
LKWSATNPKGKEKLSQNSSLVKATPVLGGYLFLVVVGTKFFHRVLIFFEANCQAGHQCHEKSPAK